MTVAEFCDWWRQHLLHRDGLSRMHGPRADSEAGDGAPQGSIGYKASSAGADDYAPLWYLKDWHFRTDFPNYEVRAVRRAMLHHVAGESFAAIW